MNKRIFAIFICLLFTIVLAGCGSKKVDQTFKPKQESTAGTNAQNYDKRAHYRRNQSPKAYYDYYYRK